MATHNGPDELGKVFVALALVLSVFNFFISSPYLAAAEAFLLFLFFFRFFSKNKAKRRAENRRFLGLFSAFGKTLKRSRNRFRYRKTHIYRRCPHCKKHLRLPRLVGEHSVLCPICSHRFSIKVK